MAVEIEFLKELYIKVLAHARKMALSENIEIHLGPILAKELELGNSLKVEVDSSTIDIPIIIEDGIGERQLNNVISSDIYIFDPAWIEVK